MSKGTDADVGVLASRMCRRRREFLGTLLAIAAWLLTSPLPGWGAERGDAAAAVDPKSIKATYLLHFARLTTFPEPAHGRSAAAAGGFIVGVLGEDALGRRLNEVFHDEKIGASSVTIRRLKSDAEAAECQLVLFGEMDAERRKTVLKQLQGRPVLTVGDGSDFVEAGGIVGFREERGKVVFEVNVEQAQRVKLRLDSRLLQLARKIVGNR